MHYYALVDVTADADDVEAEVAAAMEPHRFLTLDGTVNDDGIWDWYRIGGRYTTVFSGQIITSRAEVAPQAWPHTLISRGRAVHRFIWTGNQLVDNDAEFEKAWDALAPDARLVVVDYHC